MAVSNTESMLDFSKKCLAAGLEVILTVVDHPDMDVEACRKIAENMKAGFRVWEYNEVG